MVVACCFTLEEKQVLAQVLHQEEWDYDAVLEELASGGGYKLFVLSFLLNEEEEA